MRNVIIMIALALQATTNIWAAGMHAPEVKDSVECWNADTTVVAFLNRHLQRIDYAITNKDIDFLQRLMDNDLSTHIRYKNTFTSNLRHAFKRNSPVWTTVEAVDSCGMLERSPKKADFYSLRAHIKWSNTNYSDAGTLFELWEFSSGRPPVLHVVVWQPDENGKPVEYEKRITLGDFDF